MNANSLKNLPDLSGRFGEFGGRFVAETLMPLILSVEESYEKASKDKSFLSELDLLRRDYIGRPSPLYFAKRLTEYFKGAKIYFKRDELNHTGAHKINNVIGQILLAKKMGKNKGNDFFEKKVTLPLIHAYEKSSKAEKKIIKEIFQKPIPTHTDLNIFLEIMEEKKSLIFTKTQATIWTERSIKALEIIEDSEIKALLIELAQEILDRSS